MRILQPGHLYEVDSLDGDFRQTIRFVKRVGPHYPGNEPPPFAGTTSQEILRVLINRAGYTNAQIACVETEAFQHLMESGLLLLEIRAKRVKGKALSIFTLEQMLQLPACPVCGHIDCSEEHK